MTSSSVEKFGQACGFVTFEIRSLQSVPNLWQVECCSMFSIAHLSASSSECSAVSRLFKFCVPIIDILGETHKESYIFTNQELARFERTNRQQPRQTDTTMGDQANQDDLIAAMALMQQHMQQLQQTIQAQEQAAQQQQEQQA
ncbi:hypothetical protein F2Q69_00043567 [Brassica cretica]|uniref:Uncharacterized protein n=1 Tax=Brassica cretica TaxID=69181 RepID=A0A8S9NM61_BRACR|nr:hypothetical protein F2Q69_00043567 [Brassica cretica]